MMARVSGSLILKTVPLPRSERVSICPPSLLMLVLTTSIPTPRPERSVTTLAVESPGSIISAVFSFADILATLSALTWPSLTALAATAS